MSKERNHTDYHIRNIDQQVLDTLLRIEELLIKKQEPAFIVQPELPVVTEEAPKPKRRFGK